MTRLVALLLLATLIAAPAAAQVINGETPLDETTLNRATPGPAVQAPSPVTGPSTDTIEPARRDLPQTAPRRD